MPSILHLGYIDASYMTALLLTKRKELIEGGIVHVNDALLAGWPTLKRALVALQGLSSRVNDGVLPRLSRVSIERFKAGDVEEWAKADAMQVALPLVTGPGVAFYADSEMLVPLNGLAFARVPGVLWSLVNHGAHQAIFLRAFIDGDRDEIPEDMRED